MKISEVTERIFAQAVALHQSGRLRTSIHVCGNEIFLLNMDKTLLLRFESKRDVFPSPVNFDCGDYDSPEFYEEEDHVVFVRIGEELERKKRCRKPLLDFERVQKMYQDFQFKNYRNHLVFSSSLLSYLEENLSHLEISSNNGSPLIVQRDIYSGMTVEISSERAKGSTLLGSQHLAGEVLSDFGPVGLRTNDFLALFAFNDRLKIKFPFKSSRGYCLLEGSGSLPFSGILTYCVYDEMGELEVIDGREESQEGRNQQKASSETDGPVRKQKMRRTKSA